jgi:hypothetical protein
MSKYSITVFFFAFFTFSISAQTVTEGQALYNSHRYSEASQVFASLLKRRPNDGLANYGYGQCQEKLGNKENAIKALRIAVKKKIATAYPLLSELCFDEYYFDEAIATLDAFLTLPKITFQEKQRYSQLLEKAKIGAQLLQHVESITIIDSLQAQKKDFYTYYSLGKDLGIIIPSQQIRKSAPSEATGYRSQRGDRVVFADSLKHRLGLYGSFQMIDAWSDPTPLSDQVNKTGSVLNYPFVSSDGVTLYFAAQGANSIGGYDLFITRFNSKENNYYAPQNMGFPFNSTANDYLMVVDEINNVGWFATDRNQPSGKVMIYKYLTNSEKQLVQTSDSDYLRLAAQLKTYKKGKNSKAVSRNTNESEMIQEVPHDFSFHVNDTIIYHTASQFISEKARAIYQQADLLNKTIQTMQQELNRQRTLYGTTESADEKSKIQPEILRLEREISGLQNRPQKLYNEARQIELDAIKEKH